MFIIILILVVAVAWLGGATAKWKVQKQNYRERLSLLRAENDALRVEKDLMITRMTIAGLLKPVKDGVYDEEYLNQIEEDDAGYSEILSFVNFTGSYNAKTSQVKIAFKINNLEETVERVEGRVFVVLGDETVPTSELKILPDNTEITADRRPDGTKGGATFAIKQFKDLNFTGTVKSSETEQYSMGIIYVFSKDGELLQIRRLDLDYGKPNNIVVEELEEDE